VKTPYDTIVKWFEITPEAQWSQDVSRSFSV